jgi:formate dehydrogenase major subunit
MLEHWHTGAMTRRSQALDQLEPEAVALVSPRELGRLGVKPGDLLRVETRRGSIEIRVRADRDVPANMIFIPFCYVEAAANLLTNPALDPFGKIPEFKYCAARARAVEKLAAAD